MPSITAPGIGSGLDVQSIVAQLMEIERIPLQRLQQKQTQLEAQISTYGQLKNTLSVFRDAMDKLATADALKLFSTTTSNENIATLTASSSADLGSFGLEVLRLAEPHKMTSAEVLDTDTFGGAAGDSLSIQIGSDPLNTLTVDLSTAATLSDIRNAINNDANNPGVQATIVNGDGGMQKLILTSSQTGSANAITLSYGGNITAATLGLQTFNNINGDTSLLDAEISIDGYTLTRSSNAINDAISGVTINLNGAAPGSIINVGIERDLEAVESAVQGFADAFNSLRASIKDYRNGRLEADSSLLSIERQVMAVLNTPAANGTYSVLSEIGLTIQKDGTMSVNSGDLNSALQNDFDGVATLFSADAQGFANRLATLADSWLDSTDGLIKTRTDGLEARIDNLENRQISMERNLQSVEARLQARFSALDALVGQLQGTGQFLTSQLAQLPGANSG